MRALLYSDWQRLEMSDQPVPELAPHEVLLRVAAAGICGSELEAFRKQSPRRPPPLIMGHEFCGVVEVVGADVIGLAPGDRVVSNSILSCGDCPACKRGDTHLCADRRLFGMHRAGAFATFVTAPVEALIPWPEGLTAAEACLAEPLANGVHVTRLLSDQRPMNVLVLGAGPIGLMCMQCLKRIVHCRVGVTDRLTTRLDAAKALGADAVFDSEDPDIARWADWDASVDAVGASPTKKASLDTIRTGGTAVWIGLHENEGPLEAYSVILAEKRIQGSYGATANDLRKGVEMMEKREVDVHTWTTSYPLSQGVEAFQRMLNPGPGDLKAVLTPENA